MRPHLVGTEAGFSSYDGYRLVNVKRVQVRIHRAVWMMHHGEIPDGMMIDHIDQNRSNNRIENLRLATPTQNQSNRGLHKNNKSGYPGVDVHQGRWRAKISPAGKTVHLGYFDTIEEAITARQEAEKKYGYFHYRRAA